jgi:glucose-6-phosphate 1-dehydrogenase
MISRLVLFGATGDLAARYLFPASRIAVQSSPILGASVEAVHAS